jgi:hypothetical protein
LQCFVWSSAVIFGGVVAEHCAYVHAVCSDMGL